MVLPVKDFLQSLADINRWLIPLYDEYEVFEPSIRTACRNAFDNVNDLITVCEAGMLDQSQYVVHVVLVDLLIAVGDAPDSGMYRKAKVAIFSICHDLLDILSNAIDADVASSSTAVYLGYNQTLEGCITRSFSLSSNLLDGNPDNNLTNLATTNAIVANLGNSATCAYMIVYVNDVEASIDFYERAFAYAVRRPDHSNQWGELESGQTTLTFMPLHQFETNDLTGEVQVTTNARHRKPFEVWFGYSDIDAAFKRAVENGAMVVMEPEMTEWGQRVGHVRDLDGIIVRMQEDRSWYSRASNSVVEPVTNNPMNTIPAEIGSSVETRDKDTVSEDLSWTTPSISGPQPKPRYKHGAAVLQDKMYVYAGNHIGRYLNDMHVLDLRSWTWSRVEAKTASETSDSQAQSTSDSCAGHSLIPWRNKLISIAGNTKDPSETIQVTAFDVQTSNWSNLKTCGKPPVSRDGQSVTLVGSRLVVFGGQDAKRVLLNDLHILDLDTLTWDEIDAAGVPPSPRYDHVAAVHADKYMYIFGGASHGTCFSDLHVLDLQTRKWSRPTQQGDLPGPRAGHAGVTVGDNWFIVGGGDNKSGAPQTVVLNMSTLVWSVVTSVQGRVPLASEGFSLVVSSSNDEDILVSFGGYNKRYNNEVHVLKLRHKSTLQSKPMEPTRGLDSESEVSKEACASTSRA